MTRVMVHTFHEHEQAAAGDALTDVEVATEGFMIGELADDQIAALEAAGVVVEPLPDVELGTGVPDAPQAGLSSALGMAPPVTAELPGDRVSSRDSFLVALRAPLLAEWRTELEDIGVTIHEQVRPDVYLTHIPLTEVAGVRGLDYVTGVSDAADETAPPPVVPASAAPGLAADEILMDLVVRRPDQLDEAHSLIEDLGLEVVGTGRRKVRFAMNAGSPAEADLRQRSDIVELLAPYVPPELHNDAALALMGIQQEGSPQPSFDGRNQIVGVADSGIDETHDDFSGRIDKAIPRGRDADPSDPHGHGTHVAGSVLGDGSSSGGQFRGAAPGAHLVFQSLLDARGGLGGLPTDLHDLFEEARSLGARIHNDSWGANIGAEYVIDASEADDFVHENPDFLIVTSAGNNGAAGAVNEPAGFVDILSMGSLAGGKNVLTVGAARSSRTTGGFAQRTYGDAWPSSFPDPPIRDQNVSGDDECLAGFSSRGPLQTMRIKPDVVAPGTDIVSARSSLAPDGNFWSSHDHPAYGYMGGTSMASPLVAGMAALVRQYYQDVHSHDPSAALLKATVINGTRRLTGERDTEWSAAFPNPHQGFGAVDYTATVPDIDAFDLEFIDEPGAGPLVQTGDRDRFAVDVGAGRELRVCLAYTDAPGRGCQNVVNLFVEEPGGQKILGNADRKASFVAPDAFNNVEIVRIADPTPGTYSIHVQARNILFSPQDHALVVTGDLAGPLSPF